MAQLRVKQVLFDQDVTFDGSNAYTITNLAAPSNDSDVATKSYVDNLAAGLDPKQSVRIATTSDIGGTYSSTGGAGGSGSFTGVDLTSAAIFDGLGITLGIGDRILVKDQTTAAENGLYVVTTAGPSGAIERAADHDGSPTNEVSGGNFTFVENGSAHGGSGWVLQGDGVLALNTDSINWTQFSESTALTAGDGIDITSGTISVDLVSGTALSFNSGQLQVDTGDGIIINAGNLEAEAWSDGGLSVGVNGIQINPDNTTGATIAPITIGANGAGVTVDNTSIVHTGGTLEIGAVDTSLITDFDESVQDAIGTILTDGTTVDFTYNDSGNTITAEVIDDSITEAKLAVTNAPTTGFQLEWNGTDLEWVDGGVTIDPGNTTGNTLRWDGSDWVENSQVSIPNGSTVNITGSSSEITATNNQAFLETTDIEQTNTLSVNQFDITTTVNDLGLGSQYDIVHTATNVEFDYQIQIGDLNSNITLSAGDAGMMRWNGTNFQGWDGSAWVNFDSASTTLQREIHSSPTGSGSSNDALIVTEVFGTPLVDPDPNTIPRVYVNGQLVEVGDGTTSADAYFGTSSGTAVAFSSLAGDEDLFWNPVTAGYEIDTSDQIIVMFETAA